MTSQKQKTTQQTHLLILSGMSCGACEKIIERIIQKNEGTVVSIDGNTGKVEFTANQTQVTTITQELGARGFYEKGKGSRGDFTRIIKFIVAVIRGDEIVKTEHTLLKYNLIATLILGILSVGAYVTLIAPLAKGAEYIPIITLSLMCSAIISFSYFHARTYQAVLTCQNGMMAGMGVGMIAGFLVGALVGATNGMFIGSLAGLAVGISTGFIVGRASGSMGGLEGIMAGLMSGLMGAMTSVMMPREVVIPFAFLLAFIGKVTIIGLTYMLYREQGAAPSENVKISFVKCLGAMAILHIGMLMLVFFAPTYGLVYPA